ncbi:MAG: HlyD family efflux transporter periplasmic adaptor subunit [Acidobacteriaceae bacterium]|nr:HlyD family efflux transporter periplasmic adaptor subunit [Acidobacteriaceae bacterium]
MERSSENATHRRVGRVIGIATVLAAVLLLFATLHQTNSHPRTDDANVRANFIQLVAEVDGRVVDVPVKDNQLVKKGELLFAIDPRPYQYALRQALADQDNLEQKIIDEQRKIAAQNSAVEAARATLAASVVAISTATSSIDVSKATVSRAQASAAAAQAQLLLAKNNLNRIEPLLEKQYVTVEQVDTQRTQVRVAQGNYEEAQAALAQAQAQQAQAQSRRRESDSETAEARAKLGQSVHAIDRVETLISQRPAAAAKVDKARLDLERCRVIAPFDAYVTNMNISEGAYAHPGVAIFTLVDSRTWWVVANYRESELKSIHRGGHVDVFLMEHPDRKFSGVVESIGYAVFPEDGKVSGGLPDVDKTLNWVHLSSRFPVRIRVEHPDPALFRIGASAVTVVR